MPDRIRIFISYKKKIRQSPQDEFTDNRDAADVCAIFEGREEYEPWMDQNTFIGAPWERSIFDEIIRSDVMLVVLTPAIGESEWVRREITLARALGVEILPLAVGVDGDRSVQQAVDLGIADLQLPEPIKVWPTEKNAEALRARLAPDIRRAAAKTREARRRKLDEAVRRYDIAIKADDNMMSASFSLVGGTSLHVAAGDIAEVKGVDVIVNSENTLMQMARFFDGRSVSSTLRRRASWWDAGTREYHDIQEQIDAQVGRNRPVNQAVVVATAVAPESDLASNDGPRVMLHVAAVQVVQYKRIVPFQDDADIRDFMRNALSKVAEINDNDGVFAPPGTLLRTYQEQRAAAGRGKLNSIIFPLFGTGTGGLAADSVIKPMVEGLVGYLRRNRKLADEIEAVYFSAYTQQDVKSVTAWLSGNLPRRA